MAAPFLLSLRRGSEGHNLRRNLAAPLPVAGR